MTEFPLASGMQHLKAFEVPGWTVRRNAKSPLILTSRAHRSAHLSIPDHGAIDQATAELRV